jgi:nucleoside-diphosphate-sugar epimerase
MARAFVTGGSGFVGRNLIRALRARGDDVVALARSENAARAVEEAGASPAHGDLDDPAALLAGVKGAQVVFHCAAKVDDFGREADFLRVNVEGTANLLHAARESGVRRLVHVSTEAVLVGGPPIVNADETWPRPAQPIGLYPKTKGMAEERVLAANAPPDFTTVIVRPRFIWGGDDSTLLPRFVEAVKKGQFVWFEGGRYLTSTCHVANVCEGAILAAERGRGGEIYFLTDGPPVEFRQMVIRMLATQGIRPGERSISRFAARTLAALLETAWSWLPLPGHPPLTRAAVRLVGEEVTVDDGKARRELGYVGRMSLEDGLRDLSARSVHPAG